jgi:hypothetical protein
MSDFIPQSPAQPTYPNEQPPMSLEEARRVIWQTQPKEPMGQLLDQGKLTRQDLEWAITKAYRVDVRRAARRLLQELDQATAPAPASSMRAEMLAAQPRHGAGVVFGSGYLEERQEHYLASMGVVIGVTAGQQMIVTLLIAMGDEAKQVEIDQPRVELLEAEDRIIADQGGIVFDAFIGNLQLRHDTLRQLIERTQLIGTADFLAHFTQTEILGLVLQPPDVRCRRRAAPGAERIPGPAAPYGLP